MVKIKKQVEMTHEEYAKHMIDKFGIESCERELIDNNIFDAPMEFGQTFTLKPMRKDDVPRMYHRGQKVFIEIEEEITEDMKIPKLLEIYPAICDGDDIEALIHKDKSINLVKDDGICASKAFYILNDDYTMTLIWRDGKLEE